jgi:hypothetical protein
VKTSEITRSTAAWLKWYTTFAVGCGHSFMPMELKEFLETVAQLAVVIDD